MHNHNIVSEHPGSKEHRHGDGRVTRRKAMRLGAALVLAGGGLLGCTDGKKGKSFSVNGGERRALLNPSRFSDPRVRMIYSLAEKYNAVLDKLFCYCQCDRPPFLHKSLLSCYAETHAARWMICLEQARWAAKWTAQGKSLDEVRRLNDRRFG